MIARRDLLRFSLLAWLPIRSIASSVRDCTFSAPRLSRQRISTRDTVDVEIDLLNDSPVTISTRVHVYVHDQVASVVRPALSLAVLHPVSLRPGERRTIRTTLGPEAFHLPAIAGQSIIEPGLFDIMAGPNHLNLKSATLEIA